MTNRVAAFIVNYNMPERADALADFIDTHVTNPCDVFVVDNGSDLQAPARNTSLRIEKNMQTTAGWLLGLEWADLYSQIQGYKYFAYWFLITSAEFVLDKDPLSPMVKFMQSNPTVVGVHPALTLDSTTSWNHMKIGSYGEQNHIMASEHDLFRQTWMMDNIASLYRADWFDSIGRFDPTLRFAWGIDLETCHKAREQNRELFIYETAPVKKVTNIGYTMERMNMTASRREQLAGANMAEVLSRKYGSNWWWCMNNEYVEERMR